MYRSIADKTMRKFILLVLLLSVCGTLFARRVTVQTQPQTARIWVAGHEVGQGTAQVSLPRHGSVLVTLTADGYYTREVRLSRTQHRGSVLLRLDFNEAFANSIGDDVALIANRWTTVTARQGMSEEEVWRRLVSAIQRDFEDIEMRDITARVIRTNWITRQFNNETVRTRLEVRPDFSQADRIGFEVRLSSQIRWNWAGSEGWRNWDRVLRRYENTISQLQAQLGGI